MTRVGILAKLVGAGGGQAPVSEGELDVHSCYKPGRQVSWVTLGWFDGVTGSGLACAGLSKGVGPLCGAGLAHAARAEKSWPG
jgi:hypothetical protein